MKLKLITINTNIDDDWGRIHSTITVSVKTRISNINRLFSQFDEVGIARWQFKYYKQRL